MSYFTPDYDYNPMDKFSSSDEENTIPKLLESKQKLFQELKQVLNDIPDTGMSHFSKATSLTFRTNTHVFDSVAFFRKFCDAFYFSLKKTFPHLSEEELSQLKEEFEKIEKIIAKMLKDGNVENKYLLPLVIGMLGGILDYENY